MADVRQAALRANLNFLGGSKSQIQSQRNADARSNIDSIEVDVPLHRLAA